MDPPKCQYSKTEWGAKGMDEGDSMSWRPSLCNPKPYVSRHAFLSLLLQKWLTCIWFPGLAGVWEVHSLTKMESWKKMGTLKGGLRGWVDLMTSLFFLYLQEASGPTSSLLLSPNFESVISQLPQHKSIFPYLCTSSSSQHFSQASYWSSLLLKPMTKSHAQR